MKEQNFTNSWHSFQQLKVEIEAIKKAIESKDFYSLDIYFMEEVQVLQFLKISKGTFHKYRKLYNITSIKPFGKNIYFKHHILNLIIDQFIK